MHDRRFQSSISHSRSQSYVRRQVSDVVSRNRTRPSYVSNRQAQALSASAEVTQMTPNGLHGMLRRWRAWTVTVRRFTIVGRQQRLAAVSWLSAGLIVISVIVPVASIIWQGGANYDLSSAKSLLTTTPRDLQQKLQYDAGKQSWLFNQAAQPATGSNLSVGNLTYSASLPTDLRQGGLSLTDTSSKVNLGFVPQFATAPGQSTDGHIVYPLRGSQSQLVYTLEKAGVKEDIVLYKAPGNTAQYSYQLQLPDSLEARLQSDGSVGIYGGSPSLFGNISYGSDKDKALVEKARQHSTKDHLYYAIPAPVVKGAGTDTVKAHFTLTGNVLTIHVDGLAKAHYPLSIDPSFVMNTTNCGWKSGNAGDNFDVSSCTLSRSTTSGGALSSWAYNNGSTTGLPSATIYAAAIMNGYMYVADVSNSGSAVSVAAISSSGVVGAFSSVVSPGNTSGSQLVAANGYLYVIGGINFTTVMMAKPSTSDGSITSWTAVSSFATSHGETGGGATFYNGKIYVAGGCTSVVLSVCNNGDFTHYATVNADGTLSAWSDGPNLPTAIYNTTLQAYNGFLYVVGGLAAAAGHAGQTTVSYAAINTDGSIGTWQSTTSLPVALGGVGAIISNGYLYAIGGVPDAQGNLGVATTYMAQVYASGRLGSFQQTTSITNGRETTAATYNGTVYILGGYSKIATSGVTAYQDIQYATINANAGGLSPITTSPNVVNTVESAATVVYGGYMYLLGGGTNSSQFNNSVYYAKLNSDGTTGIWNTTSAFTDGRMNPAAAAYNGYMYVAGGTKGNGATTNCTNDGTVIYCKDIQKAAINADGTLGAWSSAGATYTSATSPAGRDGMGMLTYNGYMYIFGGNYNSNSSVSSEVDVAPINADGTVGTWTQNTTGMGATGYSNFGLAQMGKYIYLVGGRYQGVSGAASYSASVVYATLSSGGGITTFSSAGSDFTTARRYSTAGVMGGYLYMMGGDMNGGGTNVAGDIQYRKIDPVSGTLSGSWTTSPTTITPRSYQGGGIYNGYLYAVGGCANVGLGGCVNRISSVQYAQIYNNGGGADATWASLGTLPSKAGGNMAVAANGYIYTIGGCANFQVILIPACTNLSAAVNYAKINGDGSLGAWTATNAMVDGDYLGAAVTYGGRIYVVGGCNQVSSNPCARYSNGVQFATICTGVNLPVAGCSGAGAVSPWQYTYSNTTAASYTAGNGFNGQGRWYMSAAVSGDGYLYIAGGANGTTTISDASQMQYAKIDRTTGTVGAWTNANSYTTSRISPGLAINGGYIYLAGGADQVNGTPFRDVQYAALASDGSVGSWTRTGDLPFALSAAGTAVSNGYLYVWSGACSSTCNAPNGYSTNLQYAPLFTNGAVGTWTVTNGLGTVAGAVGRAGFGAVISQGYVYALGGFVYTATDSGHIASDNNAYYAPLQGQAAVSHYSMQLTTDRPTLPANFFLNTTKLAGSTITVGLGTATTTSPAFGSINATSNPVAGSKYNIGITGDGVNYYWVAITLDDSKAMAFGETGGSKVSYFQLNYHPNVGMRLRGGKTFNSQQLQSLDAY